MHALGQCKSTIICNPCDSSADDICLIVQGCGCGGANVYLGEMNVNKFVYESCFTFS